MEAVEEGPVAAAAGTLTAIVTVIPGWETIANAVAAATLGIARQPDPTYRTAYRTRTGHRALGPMAGIEAAIDEALAGRQVVKENNTDAGYHRSGVCRSRSSYLGDCRKRAATATLAGPSKTTEAWALGQ